MMIDWGFESGAAITLAVIIAIVSLVFYLCVSISEIGQFIFAADNSAADKAIEEPFLPPTESQVEQTSLPPTVSQVNKVKPPSLSMKNCVKNDGGVTKEHAV